MNKLNLYLQLDKRKRQLEIAYKMNAPKSAIDFANNEIDILTKELGMIKREPTISEMIIDAYCKEDYRNKVFNYLKVFLGLENISFDSLNNILNNSYQDIYNTDLSINVKLSNYKIEWAEFLKMGRFKNISEMEYKRVLLNRWAAQVYLLEKDSQLLIYKENASKVIDWIKEHLDIKPTIKRNDINNPIESIINNQFPNIFKGENNQIFDFYDTLKTRLLKNSTPYAVYSFIFSKFTHDGLLVSNKHKDFMEFIEAEDTSLKLSEKYENFKHTSSKNNELIYDDLFNRFQLKKIDTKKIGR